MPDNLQILGSVYANAVGIKATDTSSATKVFVRPQGTKTITSSGTTDVAAYAYASVAAGTAATPATTITATPTISVNASGLITATNSKTQSVTPTVSAGYITSGTAGTVTVDGSNTSQLTTKAAETFTPTTIDQTIAAGQYLAGAQTIAGDSNLVASNIASGVTIFGVTGTHEGGGAGWETCPESWATGLIDRTLSGAVYGSMVLTIRDAAFYNCSALTTASFPSCTTIGSNAFQYCTALTTASFPSCTYIGNSAFMNCSALTPASFPSCTYIGNNAFAGCTTLTTASFPNCTAIGYSAFVACINLTTAYFPNCTTISDYAFQYCSRLASIYFLGQTIPSFRFICFSDTPMVDSTYLGYYGSIYVLPSMVNAFKAAVGWSSLADRIVAYGGV